MIIRMAVAYRGSNRLGSSSIIPSIHQYGPRRSHTSALRLVDPVESQLQLYLVTLSKVVNNPLFARARARGHRVSAQPGAVNRSPDDGGMRVRKQRRREVK